MYCIYNKLYVIGLTFLPTRIATWRYERGNRSLAANLSAGDGGSTTINVTSPSATTSDAKEESTSQEIDIPDEVEEVIDQLIQGLGSGDSVVR